MRNTAVQMLATKVMALNFTTKEMLYFLDWYQLALEMEKQEIIKAYDQGICEGFDYGYHNDNPKQESGEQYYQETYEKNA